MASSRIFIRGLPPSLSHDEFDRHFSKPFKTTDARLIPQRGIGYVGYKTSDDALKAVKFFNKSYIRMSRIRAEIAHSVQERNALKVGANASMGIKRKYDTMQATDLQENDSNFQAMKNKDVATVGNKESKLEEFLNVMRPRSKSKIWEDHAALTARVPTKSLGDESLLRTDSKSEKDCEVLPEGRRETHMDHQETEQTQPEKEVDQVKDINIDLSPNEGEESKSQAAQLIQAQSDSDWLRLRTSRLLGLMDDDDDDALAGVPRLEEDETQETKASKLRHVSASNDPIVKDLKATQEVPETDTLAADSLPGVTQSPVDDTRLFIRNLAYSTTVLDLQDLLNDSRYGAIQELHLPIDSRSGKNKGFAHIQFVQSEGALAALSDLDQKPFQGRLLHVIPADARKETGLDEFALAKLPLKKQQQIKRKAEAAQATFSWNAMYMNSDAIISSISDRLSVAKSELLDPTSSSAAIKQAHAETHIIQETKLYFSKQGVNLDAFKRKERGDTGILIKNFAYGSTVEELKRLFEPHGPIKRLLMPPSGTIAIVEFAEPDHARSAFQSIAFRKFKDSILFLEKAPRGLFSDPATAEKMPELTGEEASLSANDLLNKDAESASANMPTLFVRNLNFITTTERLREVFQPLNGFRSARVKTKPDLKKPGQYLSLGFGFIEFRTKQDAQSAQRAMDNYNLDGHDLLIRPSHKAIDAAEERRNEDRRRKEASHGTKIIIKNLPFEASKKDVRSLFGSYGQLRSVRVPKKFDSSTRGFAFAEFVTAREAENAMDVLRDTHLLGRRLVLEFAAGDALDPEEEIEKMQQKIGKQADKVALQHLTGSGRKKFKVGNEELNQG